MLHLLGVSMALDMQLFLNLLVANSTHWYGYGICSIVVVQALGGIACFHFLFVNCSPVFVRMIFQYLYWKKTCFFRRRTTVGAFGSSMRNASTNLVTVFDLIDQGVHLPRVRP